eukprot:CAMPEP_0198132668 /NCGR_PEP_ID=MMETSP1442-20131203/58812_1 /TAXON_ID= /ORGANISM="Craspedostauros australis, Strain CCMP3328" /LENGTH=75 /DNA_ID=CAMNT_0043793723 /DNA_START=652 /DNA_END=879 /DNA_ORIENTATION=-
MAAAMVFQDYANGMQPAVVFEHPGSKTTNWDRTKQGNEGEQGAADGTGFDALSLSPYTLVHLQAGNCFALYARRY